MLARMSGVGLQRRDQNQLAFVAAGQKRLGR
jgi:hypothetical protein